MALQVNLPDTSVGLPAPEAYARIVTLYFETNTGRINLTVDFHANFLARHNGRAPVKTQLYSGTVGIDVPNLDDTIPGIRSALYEWLKTLPDFAGAIDV